MSTETSLQTAIRLHQSGQLDPARRIYWDILGQNPNDADAHHFLGMLEHQSGAWNQGLAHLRQSVAINPNQPFYYNNLGNTLKDLGQVQEAVEAYQKGIRLDPQFFVARYNLARLLMSHQKHTEAAAELEAALRVNPQFPEGWKALGQCQIHMEKLDMARQALERAISIRPDDAEIWFHLSDCFNRQKDWTQARQALEKALQIRPIFPEAVNNLGLVFKELGQLEEAKRCFHKAIDWDPRFTDPCNNLGQIAKDKGQKEEAFHWHQRALGISANDAQSHFCMGNLMADIGKLEEAMNHFQLALKSRPDFPQLYNNMGNVLMSLKRNNEARQVFQQAIESKPDFHEAYANFGNLDKETGFPDLAEKSLLEAIRLKPDFAAAYSNLGNAYFDQGKLEQALESYRKGIELGQDEGDFVSNYLFCLNYCPDFTDEFISGEHLRLCRAKFGHLGKNLPGYDNQPHPEKPLRIGYVSPDFGAHPVARFMHPLLKHHNRKKVEVFVYSLRYLQDPVTRACRPLVENWRDVYGSTDEELAQKIRTDKIDILVDLIMHARDCRPRLFARKPAPIQVSYLAYAGTTGLDAIDYRLTDSHLDPIDKGANSFVEKPLRLPHSWWCYLPPLEVTVPEVAPPPFLKKGFITFGSLNNFVKVHPKTQATWAEILNQVPGSHLLIHIKEGRHRERVKEFFSSQGIAPERITMIGYQPTLDYFKTYHDVDIALDTFPFAGGTTTCDALWMGVPVVTLAGDRTVSRGGISILSTMGRTEWIAQNKSQYVTKAVQLAQNPEDLINIRKKLREEMKASPLMDADRFTGDVEDQFRMIWKKWCEKETSGKTNQSGPSSGPT